MNAVEEAASPHITRRISRTLTDEECWSLLAGGGPVGRVAVIVEGKPHVVPVNYAVVDDVVVFRTAARTILDSGGGGQIAFEVDGTDTGTRSGWSVCVHGHGADISDASDRDSLRLRAALRESWAPRRRDRWYKVVADEVTGRRLYGATDAAPG